MYTFLLHHQTLLALQDYLRALRQGHASPGQRLSAQLAGHDLATLDADALLEALVNSKSPQIFAESAVRGDGQDWTLRELGLLGDLGVAVPVSVYDDGRHHAPRAHVPPLTGTLLFTPGALLRNDQGLEPADWQAVTRQGRIDQPALDALYERRLLPLFAHAQQQVAQRGEKAVITVPGLGCGQFAGPFRGRMGEHLRQSLLALLQRHAGRWPDIAVVWFDPYNECRNETVRIGTLEFKVRPLLHGNEACPQLCRPEALLEGEAVTAPLRLFSLVAWDHVSWPGNDFYLGARATDDGVKAAATSSMQALTGVTGHYDEQRHAYLPPSGYRHWDDVVRRQGLRLRVRGRVHSLPPD